MPAYRLPREPSTPRISLWRRLKRLGVVQLLDGLVALPADAKTREQLEWAAEEVIEAGGDATLWIGRPGTAAEERSLAARMSEAVAADYRAVIPPRARGSWCGWTGGGLKRGSGRRPVATCIHGCPRMKRASRLTPSTPIATS